MIPCSNCGTFHDAQEHTRCDACFSNSMENSLSDIFLIDFGPLDMSIEIKRFNDRVVRAMGIPKEYLGFTNMPGHLPPIKP